MLRRLIRIVPLYWGCTLLVVVLVSTGIFQQGPRISANHIFASLFFIPAMDTPLFEVGWTLNYEMYFYAIFAFWLAFWTTYRALFLISATVIGAIVAANLLTWGQQTFEYEGSGFFASPIAIEFCFGLLLAAFFSDQKGSKGLHIVVGLIGLSLLLWTAIAVKGTVADEPYRLRSLVWGPPAAAIVYSALAVKEVRTGLGAALLLIGNTSYSIYLAHVFVVIAYSHGIKKGLITGSPVPWVLSIIVVAILVGIAVFYLIERPMTRFLQARFSPKRPVLPEVSATAF